MNTCLPVAICRIKLDEARQMCAIRNYLQLPLMFAYLSSFGILFYFASSVVNMRIIGICFKGPLLIVESIKSSWEWVRPFDLAFFTSYVVHDSASSFYSKRRFCGFSGIHLKKCTSVHCISSYLVCMGQSFLFNRMRGRYLGRLHRHPGHQTNFLGKIEASLLSRLGTHFLPYEPSRLNENVKAIFMAPLFWETRHISPLGSWEMPWFSST